MPWRPAVASWRLVGIFESRLKHFLGWSCVWVASRPVQNGPERLCRSLGRRGGRMGVQIGRNRNARIAELPRDQIEIANLQGERLSLSEPRRGEREQASSNCLGGIPGKDPGRYCSTDDACQYRADVAEMFPGEPLRLRARPPVLYCAIRAASKAVIAASRGRWIDSPLLRLPIQTESHLSPSVCPRPARGAIRLRHVGPPGQSHGTRLSPVRVVPSRITPCAEALHESISSTCKPCISCTPIETFAQRLSVLSAGRFLGEGAFGPKNTLRCGRRTVLMAGAGFAWHSPCLIL